MARKPRNTKTGYDASIMGGSLYFEDAHQCPVDDPRFASIIGDGYTNAIRVVSLDVQWLLKVWVTSTTQVTEKINVEMTIRRENRSGVGHWYAYRRVAGKLYKRYVGSDERVSQDRLLEIAQKMPSL